MFRPSVAVIKGKLMSVTLTPLSSIFAFQQLPSGVELGDRVLNLLPSLETALPASHDLSVKIITT